MGLKLSIPLTDMTKDESFSVPWIFVFFPRGGLKDRGLERELQKAYWNTGNIFLFLLLLPRTSVNNRQTSTLSFTHSGPGFLVLHNLPELARLMFTESVMPSNHLFLCGPPSPPSRNLSSHQGLFQWVSSLHQVAREQEPAAWYAVSPRKVIYLCLMLLPQPVQPSLGFPPQSSCLPGFQTNCRL